MTISPGVSATTDASGHPSPSPTPEDSPAGFSRCPATFSFFRFSAPWRPPTPAASTSTSAASDVAPPPAAAPPGTVSAPLPSGFSSVSVGVVPASPSPPEFLASPSDYDSSVSSLLHLVLSAALSSVSVPPTRYFPPMPSLYLPTGGSSVSPPLLLSIDSVVGVASVVPLAAPAVPRFAPLLSLDILPVPLPPPPPSLGILRLPVPPLAPPPPALYSDIARKDEDVGNRPGGGGEARWSTAGGYAPCGKCPSRPLALVGGGINKPLFLHRPQ